MLKKLISLPREAMAAKSYLFFRIWLAAEMTLHGYFASKVPAQQTIEWFRSVGVPSPEIVFPAHVATLAIGSICIFLGLATRFWASAVLVVIISAQYFAGMQPGAESIDYRLMLIGALVFVILMGGHRYSLDNLILKRLNAKTPAPVR